MCGLSSSSKFLNFSDHLALPGDAVILVGDFNANSASLTIQALDKSQSTGVIQSGDSLFLDPTKRSKSELSEL